MVTLVTILVTLVIFCYVGYLSGCLSYYLENQNSCPVFQDILHFPVVLDEHRLLECFDLLVDNFILGMYIAIRLLVAFDLVPNCLENTMKVR